MARTRGSSFSKKSRDGSWVKRASCGVFLSLTSSSSESSSVLEQASSLMGFVGYGYPGNGGSGSELCVPICIHIPSHIPSHIPYELGAIWSYHMTDGQRWLPGSSNVVLLEALTQSSSQSMWWVNPGGFSIQPKDHYMSIGSQDFAKHENGFSLEVAILRV